MARINLEGGAKITTYSPPPANFNPLTASQADLTRHGFPTRPDDPHHLARYQRVFGQLKSKFHYVEATLKVNPEKRHGPRSRAAQAGSESSTNWSGAVVFAPSGDSFKWVEGDWVVPNVDAPTQNQWVLFCKLDRHRRRRISRCLPSWGGVRGLSKRNHDIT